MYSPVGFKGNLRIYIYMHTPQLVLKGIDHYWTYVLNVSKGLKRMEVGCFFSLGEKAHSRLKFLDFNLFRKTILVGNDTFFRPTSFPSNFSSKRGPLQKRETPTCLNICLAHLPKAFWFPLSGTHF